MESNGSTTEGGYNVTETPPLNDTIVSSVASILESILTTAPPSVGVTNGTDSWLTDSVSTAETPPIEKGFSNMQKWFIATGSIILTVIVLFCLNCCIQYKVCEKVARKFQRHNQMVEMERRSHADRDKRFGYHDDHASTRTHVFLHKLIMKGKD